MLITDNIFLVGPMGSGKSTIGRQLARILRKRFYDSDREIEKRTGVTISWIFEREGEEGFRDREQRIIEELSAKQNIVLATGGGSILREENRELLKQNGKVIYLSSTVDQLYKRTANDKKRPLLQTGDRRQQVENLFKMRDPLYREVADIVIQTGSRSVQNTVNTVIRKLKQAQKVER
jgi:shikimate kinase